jgi:hypothetical protein
MFSFLLVIGGCVCKKILMLLGTLGGSDRHQLCLFHERGWRGIRVGVGRADAGLGLPLLQSAHESEVQQIRKFSESFVRFVFEEIRN